MLLTEPFEDALRNQPLGPVLSKAASVECISPVTPRAPDAKMLEELNAEPWYQGEMSRKEAEALLQEDGDFLVRKSTTNPGSFVLTGMHNGQAKHLLLVDPEGTVRHGQAAFSKLRTTSDCFCLPGLARGHIHTASSVYGTCWGREAYVTRACDRCPV